MVLLNNIRLNPDYRIIAFAGGRGRGYLIRRIAEELSAANHKVIISGMDNKKFPSSGSLLIAKNISLLKKLLESEFRESSIIYIGKEINDNFIQGYSISELSKLQDDFREFYWLIDLGNSAERMVMDLDVAPVWIQTDLWQQLIYAAEVSVIDRPPDNSFIENFEGFRQKYPEADTFSQEVFLEYLTSKQRGLGAALEQKWPFLLLFTDANLIPLENRAISISREAYQRGIQNIALSNLDLNLIKKIHFNEQ